MALEASHEYNDPFPFRPLSHAAPGEANSFASFCVVHGRVGTLLAGETSRPAGPKGSSWAVRRRRGPAWNPAGRGLEIAMGAHQARAKDTESCAIPWRTRG